MAITLYYVDWCPDCEVVRQKLAGLGLTYNDIIVPDIRPMRKQVYEVSGQYYVPVLQDGDTVLSETRAILSHLDRRYGAEDEGHEASGKGEDAPSCRL